MPATATVPKEELLQRRKISTAIREEMLVQGETVETVASKLMVQSRTVNSLINGSIHSEKGRQRLCRLLAKDFWVDVITPPRAAVVEDRALVERGFAVCETIFQKWSAAQTDTERASLRSELAVELPSGFFDAYRRLCAKEFRLRDVERFARLVVPFFEDLLPKSEVSEHGTIKIRIGGPEGEQVAPQ